MEIKASELRKGVECDLPVDWSVRPARQCTIRYDAATGRYVMADIKTKEIHYSYTSLSDLLRVTNRVYDYNDTAVED